MSGLVAQDAHQPVAIASLHFAHESPLEADQSLVRQIKRNGDAGNAVGENHSWASQQCGRKRMPRIDNSRTDARSHAQARP